MENVQNDKSMNLHGADQSKVREKDFKFVVLSEQDVESFKYWLCVNIDSASWNGRNIVEFEKFWNGLFTPETYLFDQVHKLNFARSLIKSGPIFSWLNWINEKLLIYTFLFKDLSVEQCCSFFNISNQKVLSYLRCFFAARMSSVVSEVNDFFLVDPAQKDLRELKFDSLITHLKMNRYGKQVNDLLTTSLVENDILQNLEVSVYEDFKLLVSTFNPKVDSGVKIDPRYSLKKDILSATKDVSVVVLITAFLSAGIYFSTKWYEKYIVNKISLFEPNFFWLDESLVFDSEEETSANEIDLSFKEIEELDKDDVWEREFERISESIFQEETDVVLTSVDNLATSLGGSTDQLSSYEESNKGGYRSYTYGRGKAYRILINSSELDFHIGKINELMQKYHLEQADNVKPGKQIPGGVYYNLIIDRKLLKPFLQEVSTFEDGTILESKTRRVEFRDKNKVFIWIKQL